MTESLDLDALAARLRAGNDPFGPTLINALIAELRETRADLERAAREFGVMAEHARTMHTRAQAAEARIARAEALLDPENDGDFQLIAMLTGQEADRA